MDVLEFRRSHALHEAGLRQVDRSAIAEASPSDFDWGAIFAGAEAFHFTGITPALSDSAAAACLDAAKAAKARGLSVSCDLNYRKNLWSAERAGRVMRGLMPFVDVLIGNEEDAEKVFGIRAEGSDVGSGELSRPGYEAVARKLAAEFGFKAVAITLRKSHSASDNGWGGMLFEDGRAHFSREYELHIVDRVGGGDSFAAGLIASRLARRDPQSSIEFAVAASALKHSIEGDFNLATKDEIDHLAHVLCARGRVQERLAFVGHALHARVEHQGADALRHGAAPRLARGDHVPAAPGEVLLRARKLRGFAAAISAFERDEVPPVGGLPQEQHGKIPGRSCHADRGTKFIGRSIAVSGCDK